MPQSLEVALIVILVALLAAVSAVAGALWFRLRSRPGDELARLAGELTDRLHALDEALRALTNSSSGPQADQRMPKPVSSGSPRPNWFRLDPAEPSAVAGPTLISIPDLGAPPSEAATVATELGRRFGAVWALADSGASIPAIARATGHPIGQVELILGLRRQLDAAAAGSASA